MYNGKAQQGEGEKSEHHRDEGRLLRSFASDGRDLDFVWRRAEGQFGTAEAAPGGKALSVSGRGGQAKAGLTACRKRHYREQSR